VDLRCLRVTESTCATDAQTHFLGWTWDLGTRSKCCLAGGHRFAEDKGDWWMTEDSYVATRVREFAHHIQCDPELAQQLYFEYDVDLTFDGADKMSLGAEIKALVSLKRKLVTERDKLNTGDLLQITYKLSGHDLKSAFEPLISQIEEMLAFGKQKFNEETSGSRANMKAHAIAHYVAAMFVAHDRNVGFGVQPLDSSEPSWTCHGLIPLL